MKTIVDRGQPVCFLEMLNMSFMLENRGQNLKIKLAEPRTVLAIIDG